MDVIEINNKLSLKTTIKVGDIVMVVKGDECNKKNWQYGEIFKVKKINVHPYGTFAFKNNKQNIDINKIIAIKNISKIIKLI